MSAPLIRPIEPGDLDHILAINEANTPEVGSVDAERMRFIVAESPIALAVEVGDTIAGFCLVLGSDSTYDSVNYRWFTQRYDDFMYLDRVAVRGLPPWPGARHAAVRGGRSRDGRTRRRGRSRTRGERRPAERGITAFHARLGFVEVGQQDTPYGIRVSMQMRPVSQLR